MLFDSCIWDDDYNFGVVQIICQQLVQLVILVDGYMVVLLQGSGSYVVEVVFGSVIGEQGKVLIVSNGVYGVCMIEMVQLMGIVCYFYDCGEVFCLDVVVIEQILQNDLVIIYIVMVYSEIIIGMLNLIEEVVELVKWYDKCYIVDVMSSFGGILLDIVVLNIDYLISFVNKCIQGVLGFVFVIVCEVELVVCKGCLCLLLLDLYVQWCCMEDNYGKWCFILLMYIVLVFVQVLKELVQEGGVSVCYQCYCNNQCWLVVGMCVFGFWLLFDDSLYLLIIIVFYLLDVLQYCFYIFYQKLKDQGFVIYLGKVL